MNSKLVFKDVPFILGYMPSRNIYKDLASKFESMESKITGVESKIVLAWSSCMPIAMQACSTKSKQRILQTVDLLIQQT